MNHSIPPPGEPTDLRAVPEPPALKPLVPKHQALAQWLYAHPTATQKQAAAALGMSQMWVSNVVNSDAFKHYVQELNGEIISDVILPLRARLIAVAERSVDRLGEAVEASRDPAFLLAAADKTLHRLGYAPTRGPAPQTTVNVQNNAYVADPQALATARAKLHGEPPPKAGSTTQLLEANPTPLLESEG